MKASGLGNYVCVAPETVSAAGTVAVIVPHAVARLVSDSVPPILPGGIRVLLRPRQAEPRDDLHGGGRVGIEHCGWNGQIYPLRVSQARRRKRHGRQWCKISPARRFGIILTAAAAATERGVSRFSFRRRKEVKRTV